MNIFPEYEVEEFASSTRQLPVNPEPRSHGEVELHHLDRLTDSTGIIQHAIYSIPRRESGYTTDDNARALRLCTRLWSRQPDNVMLERIAVYLSFLEHARCPVRGFHNFMGYQRDWLDAAGTGDCQGQAVLALAQVQASRLPEGFRLLARELINTVLPTLADLRSLRAQAYVVMAWGELRNAGGLGLEPFEYVARLAARRLVECFERSRRPDWPWFESQMTYANAVLPHALYVAAMCWPGEAFLEIAESSFSFLCRITSVEDLFWPVGNCDWYPHGESKALYDQQPVEASTMADAALTAFDATNHPDHLDTFRHAHLWFQGRNSLNLPLVDVRSGSCFDALQATGANRNQGAESTLAWLSTALHNECLMQSNRDNPLARTTTR